jgi:hypothetical protein
VNTRAGTGGETSAGRHDHVRPPSAIVSVRWTPVSRDPTPDMCNERRGSGEAGLGAVRMYCSTLSNYIKYTHRAVSAL